MAFPVYDHTLAPPGRATMPNIVGGVVEGGRSASGIVTAADLTGGGLVTTKFMAISAGNSDPARQRYLSQLGGMLNGGVRSIIVPLLTDFIAPAGAAAAFSSVAALNAGTVEFVMSGGFITDFLLAGGEWFEVLTQGRSYRAHTITDIDSVALDPNNGTATYTVGIRPPLREAVAVGQKLNFNRPQCLMRLAPGSSLTVDVEKAWLPTTTDITLIESFGTL